MMWDLIISAWLAALDADSALTTALGGAHVYAAQASRPVRIPSVEWEIVDEFESESFNPITVQVDIFAASIAQCAVIEKRVRLLTHRDLARPLGGHMTWTRFLAGRTIDFPSQPGAVHKALDFLFEPIRAKYALIT